MRWMLSACLAAFLLLAATGAWAADTVWIEAESPTSVPTIKPPEAKPDDKGYSFSAWGNVGIISGGKLLSINLSDGEAAARLPEGGAVFGYSFEIKSPGAYQIWARVGLEWVRSPFDWRLDDGPWKTIPPTQPTCDVQLLQNWNELAWLQIGEQALAAGPHSLQLRHTPQTRQDAGKAVPARTLHITDCFCIFKGQFRPNGKFRPDEDYQTAEDKQAAAQVYEVRLPDKPEERAETDLSGLWQIARWDEAVVKEAERLEPPDALPANLDQLFWFGIKVPGDRDALRPDLAYSHRYICRTKLKVPAEAAGHGFFLDFQNFNMIAAVFVNGTRCAWSRAHSTAWQPDVTAALRPGQVNDLAVVFKDAYYALQDTTQPLGTRHWWNLPHDWLHNQSASWKFDMPVAWDTRTGILEPVALVVAGPVYVADVFARPSVRRKELGLEITVANPGPKPVAVSVANEIVPWKGAKAEKTFAAAEATVPAGGQETLSLAEPWASPRLWWPDDPQLYNAVTTLSVGGKAVDVRRTRFGFREWTWDGPLFKLNGVNWQMWADCNYGPTPQAFIEQSKTSGMNMVRYWRRDGWGGMTRRQVLDYLDEQGMPVRDSGIFDGEVASYRLAEGRGDELKARQPLFDHWADQLAAWVRAERNHPSVFVWSIENEVAYINARNLGWSRVVEPELRRAAEMVMKLDPTRPAMVDGGRALDDMSLPINGGHYNDLSGVSLRDFPDAAYTTEHWFRVPHRGWPMAPNRPIFHGECFFADGWTPARFATLGGERCFIGMAETHPARSLYARMLSEGWRWAGVAAWHMWFVNADRGYWNAWQPVCVLCRQWNWTFAGGSAVPRALKIFNSTRRDDPIEMGWQLLLDGKPVAQDKKIFSIKPGETQETEVTLALPAVADRTKGEFLLTCGRNGKEVFREAKPLWVIPPDAAPKPSVEKADLAVLDPFGTAKARLLKRGIAFTEVPSVDKIPEGARMVLVGKDAVPQARSTDPLWMRLAAAGTRLLVLDQAHPLHFQAVPADFEVAEGAGRIAFAEDLGHPVFAGLDQPDFFTWSGDHVVYRNAYRKASRGARSLAQCDEELGCSAIAECQLGDGLMLLCQMAVGEKLATDPVAQRLFDNLVNYAAAYKPVRKTTALVVDAASPKGKLLRSLGLQHDEMADPVAAIDGSHGIAVIEATPASLKALAASLPRVRAFTDQGGWIMLWGLTPEGLADFNRIVGVDHLLRPFQMERVLLAAPRDPLTSGLTLRDVVMEDSEKIQKWTAVRWAADDAFTWIVDTGDIAPFAKLPSGAEMGVEPEAVHPRADHWPPNLVNGFTADDSWRYCYSIGLDKGHKTRWTMELPREEELASFSIVLNVIYHKVTAINLYFDDDPKPLTLHTRPTHDRQDFSLEGRKARRVTIELAEWEKSGRANVIGIDNLWLGVKRPEAFLERVRPLLNIGGLVRYNLGKGGIVLNQLRILPQEKLPVNAEKKGTITKTILKNLGATFEGSRTVIAGAGLACAPIVFAEDKLNAYVLRDKKEGWFRHPVGDLSHMPRGENVFAGVRYSIPDFRTSPVPSCIILRGKAREEGVAGIKIGRKADALFFLHTLDASRQAQGWKPDRRNQGVLPVVFQYVVHYKDGATAEVPVVWNEGVGHWLSKAPQALKDAAVGWAAPFANDDSGDQAVVYSMQWNNPRPDAEIEAVDFVAGPEKDRNWGSPALLAITAATVAK